MPTTVGAAEPPEECTTGDDATSTMVGADGLAGDGLPAAAVPAVVLGAALGFALATSGVAEAETGVALGVLVGGVVPALLDFVVVVGRGDTAVLGCAVEGRRDVGAAGVGPPGPAAAPVLVGTALLGVGEDGLTLDGVDATGPGAAEPARTWAGVNAGAVPPPNVHASMLPAPGCDDVAPAEL